MPPQTPKTMRLSCRDMGRPTASLALQCFDSLQKSPKRMASGRDARLRGRGDRQRPIVPQSCPCSIVGAGELNDRVRDGNGCIPSAIVTSLPARTDERAKNFRELECHSGSTHGETGNVLLSHRAAPAVSSGLESLTTVFGMGTGVSP